MKLSTFTTTSTFLLLSTFLTATITASPVPAAAPGPVPVPQPTGHDISVIESRSHSEPIPDIDSTSSLHTRAEKLFECGNSWGDGIGRRYRFKFRGYSEGNMGQDFLGELGKRGLIVHNWQCWKEGDMFVADFTTTPGLAWSANIALEKVIGYWKGCWPNQ